MKSKSNRGDGQLKDKVALITGAASGIGLACAQVMHEQGAYVTGLDINPKVSEILSGEDRMGIACDITDQALMKEAVDSIVSRFGGLDVLVSNAGIFTASQYIEELEEDMWNKSLQINLTAAQRLLKLCIPHLKKSEGASVLFIGSRNVSAPGPGAAAYSVAKAGLTQLARVAALELAGDGIRVNVIHPDAVFDTALWTPETLKKSAERYGLTVEEYKTKNLLKTEIGSRDVATLACAVCGPAFSKTTGAQIPIDGGNERVI